MKKKLILMLVASSLLAMQTQAMIEIKNTSNQPVYVYFTRKAQQENAIKSKARPQVRYQTQRGIVIGRNLFFDAAQSCQLTAIPAGSQITVPGFRAGNQPFYFFVSTLDANGLQNALNALPTTQMDGQNVARITDGSVKAYVFPAIKKWKPKSEHKVVLRFNNANKKLMVSSSTAAKRLILTQAVPGFSNLGNMCVAAGMAVGGRTAQEEANVRGIAERARMPYSNKPQYNQPKALPYAEMKSQPKKPRVIHQEATMETEEIHVSRQAPSSINRIRNARNSYEVLGVPQGASKTQVKNAYKSLVKKYHPDKFETFKQELSQEGINSSEELNSIFLKIQNAFSQLK